MTLFAMLERRGCSGRTRIGKREDRRGLSEKISILISDEGSTA
jgi:hypothetical protein